MHKCLFLFLFFVATQISPSYAQHHRGQQDNSSNTHDYYIYISGVNARTDVEKIESTIQKKAGVTYFLAKRYPVSYFLLKSTNPVSAMQFSSWIDQRLYKVEYFGDGINSKEQAIVTGKKFKKIQ